MEEIRSAFLATERTVGKHSRMFGREERDERCLVVAYWDTIYSRIKRCKSLSVKWWRSNWQGPMTGYNE